MVRNEGLLFSATLQKFPSFKRNLVQNWEEFSPLYVLNRERGFIDQDTVRRAEEIRRFYFGEKFPRRYYLSKTDLFKLSELFSFSWFFSGITKVFIFLLFILSTVGGH